MKKRSGILLLVVDLANSKHRMVVERDEGNVLINTLYQVTREAWSYR